ncbi:phage/plasmid primase, P4 family [Gordonia amicalis]|uniref:DNA primase family protein n=1 Tax=Gordonia amicalis TaxID=89053 RepID=UPI0022B38B44|nr:phage/plasmid primase, P4 family [Gordonia amicalis]MCZ4580489.1 phage/plasmid primase, P4 family [Gordonia amicalis]
MSSGSVRAMYLVGSEPDLDPEISARYKPSSDYLKASDGKPFAESVAVISKRCADSYLTADRIPTLKTIAPATVHDGLLNEINRQILAQNERIKTAEIHGTKRLPLTQLGFAEVARLILALYSIISISPSSRNSDPDLNILAAYDDDPASPTFGTYRSSQGHIRSIARRYCLNLTTRDFAEIIAALSDSAPRRTRGDNRDLIAVNNGIIDYNNGDPQFIDFSPEFIFLAKLDVAWNPDARNVVIHNDTDGTDWDVESWMESLSDDPEVVELLWEIIGATVRPYVSWNRCAFFYSEQGNNGKGTLLSLMRNLIGVQSYASVPLADFGKDFLLEPLTRASAILVDENDVGTFIEKAANFKAIVTNDVITINRKYKSPIAHQHFGFMVQCLNDKPTIKDKSESFYRRQLFVPFTKCFTGAERRYIKDDYLTRADVLEYVLKRVLTMSYYSLSEPQAVKDALEDFKESNDPIRAFWNEVKGEFSWDLVPFPFAYDLYKAWMARNMPNSKPLGRNKFIDSLVTLVRSDRHSMWLCEDHRTQYRPGDRMTVPEELIYEYTLVDWANVAAPKTSPKQYSTLPSDRQKNSYRGLIRRDTDELADAASEAQQEHDREVIDMLAARDITISGRPRRAAEAAPETNGVYPATVPDTTDPFVMDPAAPPPHRTAAPPTTSEGSPAHE